MENTRPVTLRRALSLAYLGAVLLFAFFALRGEWQNILDHVASAGVGSLVLALCCSVAALLAGMLVFRAVLRSLGYDLALAGSFRIYFVSQLGKYLPGSVWPALVQVRLGDQHGIRRSANLASFFMGLVLSIAVGVTTGFVVLSLVEPGKWLAPAAISVAALSCGFLLLPRWEAIVVRLPGFLRTRLPDQPPQRRPLLEAVALLIVSWVLHGLQVAVLARALGFGSEQLTLRSIGAFALAYAGGILFIIAPAGAGVREAILASVLGGSDVGLVAAVVLLSRVILLVADLGLGLLGGFVSRRIALPAAGADPPGETALRGER